MTLACLIVARLVRSWQPRSGQAVAPAVDLPASVSSVRTRVISLLRGELSHCDYATLSGCAQRFVLTYDVTIYLRKQSAAW